MSMNHLLKSLMVALLVTASAQAVPLYWTGAVSTNYMEAGNWSLTSSVPSAGQLPVANDAPNIWWATDFTPTYLPHLNTTAPSVTPITVGSVTNPGYFYIEDGAVMTTGNSGYQFGRRGGIYMSGGSVTSTYNMWVHQGSANTGTSTIELTGGTWTLTSGDTFTFLNRNTSARAWLNVYGGTFNNNGNWRRGDSSTAYTDVQWGITLKDTGQLTWPWNKVTTVGYITATTKNLKTGDPKQGLVLTWNTAGTYVTAKVQKGVATPLIPVDGAVIEPSPTATTFAWTMPVANYAGTQMTANLRLGTYDVNSVTGLPVDPNGDLLPTIATGIVDPNLLDNDIVVSTTFVGTDTYKYQWRVDCIDPGDGVDPNYPKTIKSRAMYVICGNQAPVVTFPTTATVAIGLRDGSVAYTVTGTVTDDALPKDEFGVKIPLTYKWTQVAGPAVAISPDNTTTLNVTLTAANTYTFRLTADDSGLTGSADVTFTVYADRCEAAKVRTGYAAAAGDFNADCWVTFADTALLAANWLTCNSLVACY